MQRYSFFIVALLVLGACHHASDAAGGQAAAGKQDSAGVEAVGVNPALKNLSFAYAKDPSCGMPLKAGLEDTVTYNGKLYGFCSKECKDAFMNDPASYLAKIK